MPMTPRAQTTSRQPLRLVHLTTVPTTLNFLSGQAGFLRRRGFTVSAISSPGPELARYRDAEAVDCFGIPMQRGIAPLRDGLALLRVWALLRRLRPDIVDAHTPKAGLLGMAAAWLAGVPVRIYHVHGLRFVTTRGVRRAVLRGADRAASRLSTRVLCVSHSISWVASAADLAPDEKMAVLLSGSINGIDADRFRPASPDERRAARALLGISPAARVVGFVGRLVREKGLVELAAAWRALRDEMPDLRLVLVGPFEQRDAVPKAVRQALESDPRVLAVGVDLDTPKYYRALDVVALPTYREGFGMVCLEAAAMGLPVVASRIPGCSDAVVDGVTGALVPPRDVVQLTGALRAYLNDAPLRERHGAAARERALRDFQQERLWAVLHQEYVRLAARARLAGAGEVRAGGDAPTPERPAASAIAAPPLLSALERAGAGSSG
jgi:glycosyltransferase involved in cell wall biosynthesis